MSCFASVFACLFCSRHDFNFYVTLKKLNSVFLIISIVILHCSYLCSCDQFRLF